VDGCDGSVRKDGCVLVEFLCVYSICVCIQILGFLLGGESIVKLETCT